MRPLSYLDFELKIKRDGDHYTAQVLRSPAGEASNAFILPFSEERVELLVLKLGRLRGTTRRIHSVEMDAARELGGGLFDAVFSGELRACLRSSLDEAAARKDATGLRLKVRLQEASELCDLPWEFLFDPSLNRFLAQSNQTPIIRYLEMPERIRPFAVSLPLCLLVMISSPSDYVRLNVERERSTLQTALDSLSKKGKVQVSWLERPTMADLQRTLRNGEYHVLHFIGHGGFDKKAEEGVLILEDNQGRGWLAGASRIGTLLHDHPSLRLGVLNSCEGARNSRTDPFAGVATTLIRQGIPAVVAMQFEITDDAAITFAHEFYASLSGGFPVDAAVAEARKAIYVTPNDVEWATPVLYMRTSDGVLFSLTQKTSPEETSPPGPELPAAAPEPEATTQTQLPKLTAVTSSNLQDFVRGMRVLGVHTIRVTSVAFSPDGKTLASGGDNTVRLWSVTHGKLLHTVMGHENEVTSVAFSPDGTMLASGSEDKTVRLWSIANGELLFSLKRHTDSVTSVAFSPDGAMLASGSHDKTVRLWLTRDGKTTRTLKGHTQWVKCVVFSPDGATIVSGAEVVFFAPELMMWRVADGKILHKLKGSETASTVTGVAFPANGMMLASGSEDKSVRLWRVANAEPVHTLKGHRGGVTGVVFSPDGTMLASSSSDKTVRLWRIPDGKLLQTLKGHTNEVNSVAFSPDGNTLASGSEDKTVRLWSLN